MKIHLRSHKSKHENVNLTKKLQNNYLLKIFRVQHIHFFRVQIFISSIVTERKIVMLFAQGDGA